MPKIRVDKVEKYPRPYWPQELKEDGYIGDLDAVPNACVLIIPKPGAKNRDIAKSLVIMAQDFAHRADIAGEQPTQVS